MSTVLEAVAKLETLENEVDLKAARATLANPGECITVDDLEKCLDAGKLISSQRPGA